MRNRAIQPPLLNAGEKVALISPASSVKSATDFKTGLTALESLGVIVKPGQFVHSRNGYLAGTDKERLYDFITALQDPTIKAVFCSRGGYGLSRLLQFITPTLLKKHPKIIIGYSDITLLHLAYQKTGIETYWGPMPCASTGFSSYSKKIFKQLCMAPTPSITNINLNACTVINKGHTQGLLTGGTLSLLTSSIGTWYEFESKNKLVFIEDVDEPLYKLDRMLTHLISANKLIDAKGLIIGKFINCQTRGTQLLNKLLTERLKPLKIPVISNFPIGHIKNQVILPYSRMANLNTATQTLSF